MNMARVKKAILIVVALFIVAQIFQPKHTNPPVTPSKSLAAHIVVPDQVQSILRRSCGDCHSNQTVWPWYSHIAPLSWVITDDVNEGRRHINFQDWEAQQDPKEATEHLASICKMVRDGGMPLPWYRFMHANTKLSPNDVRVLCDWSNTFAGPPAVSGGPPR